MTENLKNENSHFLKHFEDSLNSYLAQQGNSRLSESISYSLKSGGKRFRPFLSYLIANSLGKSFEQIKSWCLAVEFIHTYSLIHDDLPCMDNDDLRRGKPTNHKVFGEAIALLAGDSLISEAFRVVSEDNSLPASTRIKLIQLLAKKIGPSGMVGGQLLDMQVQSKVQIEELKHLHLLKTGNLIQAAAVGSAEIFELNDFLMKSVADFSLHLGIAFQIKDDLLDFDSSAQDLKNYAHALGVEIAKAELEAHSKMAVECISSFENHKILAELVQFNLARTI